MILLDTSILIEYYRNKDKAKTKLFQLSSSNIFSISVITKFEFLAGTKPNNILDTPDILIASTSIHYNIPIATLNINHFQRIKNIQIIG